MEQYSLIKYEGWYEDEHQIMFYKVDKTMVINSFLKDIKSMLEGSSRVNILIGTKQVIKVSPEEFMGSLTIKEITESERQALLTTIGDAFMPEGEDIFDLRNEYIEVYFG